MSAGRETWGVVWGPPAETIKINGREFRVVSSAPAETPAKPAAPKGKARRAIPKPLDGEPVKSGTLFLSMAPPSVNGLFFNKRRGRGKTLVYRNWCIEADRQLRDQPSWHVPGRVAVSIRVGGSGADADNVLKAALDALVTAGRIEGDSPKHVVKASAEHDGYLGTQIEIRQVPS